MVCGDRSLTFGEVDTAANRMAHVLAGLGVTRGGRVGLLTGNGIWSTPVDSGCVKAGAVRAGELASLVDGLRLASLGPAPQADALDLLAETGQASDADPRAPATRFS